MASAAGGPTLKADSGGQLRVPLPRFPLSRDAAVRGVADGNDIAVHIARK